MSKEKYGNKGDKLKFMKSFYPTAVPPFFIIEIGETPSKEKIAMELAHLNAQSVSVRSSPNHSLPGILNTVLNVKGDNVELVYVIANDIIKSVNSEKVQIYKENEGIIEDIKTAVIVQAMVFGNKNENSGTGVVFSSNPINGDSELYGEYLPNAQGEELVSGETTPLTIKDLEKNKEGIYLELYYLVKKLENIFGKIQDVEFTFEDNKLFLLQTRDAKVLQKANYIFNERLLKNEKITQEQFEENIKSVGKIETIQYDLNNFIPIAQGIGASSGLLFGKVTLGENYLDDPEAKIYVAELTTTDDINKISKSQGILTVNGGKTSHAAIVSRSWGKVCVVGCGSIQINAKDKNITIEDQTIEEGEYILIDGDSGKVYLSIHSK